MPKIDWSRDPITLEVNGNTCYSYCRLFPSRVAARGVYWPLADRVAGSNTSLYLIREPEEEWTWAIMVFSDVELEILAFSPCIHDFGRPYRSRYLSEAVCHAQMIRAKTEIRSRYTISSGPLENLDPEALL